VVIGATRLINTYMIAWCNGLLMVNWYVVNYYIMKRHLLKRWLHAKKVIVLIVTMEASILAQVVSVMSSRTILSSSFFLAVFVPTLVLWMCFMFQLLCLKKKTWKGWCPLFLLSTKRIYVCHYQILVDPPWIFYDNFWNILFDKKNFRNIKIG
jgi:hypothetical protein